MNWPIPLLVFAGGGLGAVLRWAIGLGVPGWWGGAAHVTWSVRVSQ